jgi:hypothetical protein
MLKEDYVVNERRSLDRALRAIDHLRDFFGHDRAIEITADRITAYAARRRDEPSKPGSKGFVKPATIRNELAALKRMFSLAVRAGKLPVRPAFPVIRVENARTGFFEEEQFRRVLDHLPKALRPAAIFAFFTGLAQG